MTDGWALTYNVGVVDGFHFIHVKARYYIIEGTMDLPQKRNYVQWAAIRDDPRENRNITEQHRGALKVFRLHRLIVPQFLDDQAEEKKILQTDRRGDWYTQFDTHEPRKHLS